MSVMDGSFLSFWLRNKSEKSSWAVLVSPSQGSAQSIASCFLNWIKGTFFPKPKQVIGRVGPKETRATSSRARDFSFNFAKALWGLNHLSFSSHQNGNLVIFDDFYNTNGFKTSFVYHGGRRCFSPRFSARKR